MINNNDNNEKSRIKIIKDSPRNESRATIEYYFDLETDLLGKGGFGEVYKVKKKNGNKNKNEPEYALKIFKKENFIDDFEKSSKILTEIKIQRSLNHKHIVKYEHSFEDKKNVYMLMEYYSKESLASLLKKRKKLEEYEIRYYMFQVLLVLQYLRRKKIVHRDLTLNNIFLKDIKTVKIGDFGLSYKASENEENIGVLCGTPHYYTPESIIGRYSYKTDIYNFGLCIYYLFGGKSRYNEAYECASLFEGQEHFPFDQKLNYSEEALDLMKQLVTVENLRIDLDKIYNHPFFNCGKGLSEDKFPEYDENNKNQFLEELRELPFKEGLIFTKRKIENIKKNSLHNSQNNNKTPNSKNLNIFNESLNILGNSSFYKNDLFSIKEEENYQKPIKLNLKNTINIKNKNQNENSKNQNSDYYLNNLKKINETISNGKDKSNKKFNAINNNFNEEFEEKIIKNDKDYDLHNISAITFQDDNELEKSQKLIYIDKINDNLVDSCGIGY